MEDRINRAVEIQMAIRDFLAKKYPDEDMDTICAAVTAYALVASVEACEWDLEAVRQHWGRLGAKILEAGHFERIEERASTH